MEKASSLVDLRELTLEEVIERKLAIDLDTDAAPDNRLWVWALTALEGPLLRLLHSRYRGNQVHLAMVLDRNRNTVRKKLKQYELIPHARLWTYGEQDCARGTV